MGILYGLVSSFLFAVGYTVIKRSYQEFPPSVTFLFETILGLLIWIPFSLIIGFDFKDLTIVLPYALISAILSEAFVFFILSKGEISITGTIFASYPIYTILFAVILLGERLSFLHWIFIAITILGTALASFPPKITKEEVLKKSYILWAIAGATAVGLSDTISKSSIDKTSATAFLFSLALMQVPISFIYLKLEKENPRHIIKFFTNLKQYKYAILGSLCSVVGLIFLWLAFENTLASIASPLTAAYPGLMIILAVIFLKERPKIVEIIGMILIFFGVIGISYFY